MNNKLILLLTIIAIFLTACTAEGTKVYKVDYKGNYPEGAFRADIENNTVFTNGQDIIEVHVKMPFDFFCYSVNKEVLCKFNINVKIDEYSEKEFLDKFNAAKNKAVSKNKTIIQERIAFYLNNEKTEEILTINDFANQSIETIPVPLIGNGPAEEDAKSDAIVRYKKLMAIIRDKK